MSVFKNFALDQSQLEDFIVFIQNVSRNKNLCITSLAPLANMPPQHPPELQALRKGLVLRANSLLMTVYGDALAARKQAVWLGSLIEVAELFGLSSRLVRTSAFRLTADGWFSVQRIGRRSYYQLSDSGLERVLQADKRIYEFSQPVWDGLWTLVMIDPTMRASQRQALQRELKWQSFGQLSPNLLAHPQADASALRDILRQTQARQQVAVLQALSLPHEPAAPLQSIMGQTFKLAQVAQMWAQFTRRFTPVRALADALSPEQAFYVRTLLIHEYRRVLLRDPNLPQAFLPADWPGVQGRALCAALYASLLAPSEAYLRSTLQTSQGPLKKTPAALLRRAQSARAYNAHTPQGTP